MINRPYYIVLDFDGTVVKHRYPAVGEDIGAVPVLRKVIKNGHRMILNTMRSHNSDGEDTLQPALNWFIKNNIPLDGININPTQKEWTSSPKVYGDVYIDDNALGAPLKTDSSGAPPYIDWGIASILLYYKGFLTGKDISELMNEGIIDQELINKLI